jgi:hypothetical protein
VPDDDYPFLEALRVGGAHVVVAQYLEHGRPCEAHDPGGSADSQAEAGQEVLFEVFERVVGDADLAEWG